MIIGLLVSIFFYLPSASADDYSSFSSPETCPAIKWEQHLSHSMFQRLFEDQQLVVYYEKDKANSKIITTSRTADIPSNGNEEIKSFFEFTRSLIYYSNYTNIRDFFHTEIGPQYWPKQIRLIYAGDQIRNLPGIGALFCRDYQTPDVMTLVVSTNFLQDPLVFARILTHELYHYVLHIKAVKLPHWLEEGLAIQFEDKSNVMGGVTSSPMMDYHSKRRPWSSLSTLGNGNNISREDVYAFYGHANLLIYYIEKNISKNLPKLFATTEYTNWESFLLQLLEPKWTNLRDMFTDFQVAKYINRQDDFNISTNDTHELSKYTVLPANLKMFLVQANRTPIEFTPPPLSGFIPERKNLSLYEDNPDFTIKWISIEKYGAFVVTDEFTHANAFPLVIRWK